MLQYFSSMTKERCDTPSRTIYILSTTAQILMLALAVTILLKDLRHLEPTLRIPIAVLAFLFPELFVVLYWIAGRLPNGGLWQEEAQTLSSHVFEPVSHLGSDASSSTELSLPMKKTVGAELPSP